MALKKSLTFTKAFLKSKFEQKLFHKTTVLIRLLNNLMSTLFSFIWYKEFNNTTSGFKPFL